MKRKGFILTAAACVLGALAGCGDKGGETMREKPIELSDLDTTVAPGKDFYQYSNGGWLKRTEMPEDRTRYGAFDILHERTEDVLKGILFDAMERKGDTTDAEWCKVGDFFASGMDTAAIEAAGLSPIQPDLNAIAAISSPSDLIREVAREASIGGSAPFYVTVEQDSKHATEMILSLGQNGLGMPDRDYYFEKGERGEQLRSAYVDMLRKLFVLLGSSDDIAEVQAKDVFHLESELADASYTRVQYRDPHLTYNKFSLKELQRKVPGIDWSLYFQNLGIEAPDSILVDNPGFFVKVSDLMEKTPINIWKDYLKVQYVLAYANALSTPFQDASFDFYGKALSGQQVQRPRWKRIASSTQRVLGEAVGKAYVREHFSPEAKKRMQELVENLRKAYHKRIEGLTWMSEETKRKAQDKLDAIVVKIGYPDTWRDYSDLTVSRDSYAMNLRNGYTFAFNRKLSKLGKPVDRGEWFMPPQTVNAYYNPTLNEIVFPAGILQPPFFDLHADDAVNYGAIGVVIGHEITHGFDDQGRLYSKDGNLQDWWTPEDAERFTERAQNLVDQFDRFEPYPGFHVSGALTLGENLADYGGLNISLEALRSVLAAQEAAGHPAKEIDGFTPLQRFFLAYSKVWRNKIREQEMKRRLKEDVHSPGEYRVNGGVYNIDAFYEAFPVDSSSIYYRPEADRPRIW